MLRFRHAGRSVEEPCPECGGRGWIVVADGGAGTARPCSCRERDVVPRLVAAAGIPPRYQPLPALQLPRSPAVERERAPAARSAPATPPSSYVESFVQEGGGFRAVGPALRRPAGRRQDPSRGRRPARADRALPGARPLRRVHLADPPDPVHLRSRLAGVQAPDPRSAVRGGAAGARRARRPAADPLGARHPLPDHQQPLHPPAADPLHHQLPLGARARRHAPKGPAGRRRTTSPNPWTATPTLREPPSTRSRPAVHPPARHARQPPLRDGPAGGARRASRTSGASTRCTGRTCDEALRGRLPAPRLDEPVGQLGAGAAPVAASPSWSWRSGPGARAAPGDPGDRVLAATGWRTFCAGWPSLRPGAARWPWSPCWPSG